MQGAYCAVNIASSCTSTSPQAFNRLWSPIKQDSMLTLFNSAKIFLEEESRVTSRISWWYRIGIPICIVMAAMYITSDTFTESLRVESYEPMILPVYHQHISGRVVAGHPSMLWVVPRLAQLDGKGTSALVCCEP